MLKNRKKAVDPASRIVHQRICRNLRYLIANGQPDGLPRGINKTAQAMGIGTGSLQAILCDADHSPSVRILVSIATYFKLPQLGTLLDSELGAE